jgi:hypothetical protein
MNVSKHDVEMVLCELYFDEFKNAFKVLTNGICDPDIDQIEECMSSLETKLKLLEESKW